MGLISSYYHGFKKHFISVFNNLDLIVFFGIIFGGALVIYLSYKSGIGQYGMGLSFVIGSFAYYILRVRCSSIFTDCRYLCRKGSFSSTLFLITNIVYLLTSISSIIIFYTMEYIRPPVFFVLITVAFVSLFIEIFNLNENKFLSSLLLIKIILLSLFYRFSRFYAFPTIPGSDTNFHLKYAKSIALTGKITELPAADKYLYSPLWHIFEAINSLILNFGLKDMLFIVVITFTIILSLFIFLVANKLFGTQAGLISALFVNIVDVLFVSGVTNINASSFVYCFLIIVIFCLMQDKHKPIFANLVILFIFCSIITHQLSTFAFFVILFAFYVGRLLYLFCTYNCDYNCDESYKKVPIHVSTNLIAYFFIFMIFYWSIMDRSTIGYTFFDSMVLRLRGVLISMFNEYVYVGELKQTVYENLFSQFDTVSNIMYNLGYSILLGLAVTGFLILLHRVFRSITTFSYFCATTLLFIIIYPATYFGFGQLVLPDRLIPFLELFLVIFSAFFVSMIYTLCTTKWKKTGIVVVTGLLIFFMITTPFINRNDAIYCKDREYRTEYTCSELKTIEWANNNVDGNLSIDPLLSLMTLSSVDNLDDSRLMWYSNSPDLSNVYIRTYIQNKPKFIKGGTFGYVNDVDLSSFISIVSKDYNQIYSVNSGTIFQRSCVCSNSTGVVS